MRPFIPILVSIGLALGCAAQTDDVADPTFSPLDPQPHEGAPGGAAGWSSESDPPASDGGSAGVAGSMGVAGASAAPSCGQNGDACCGAGLACTQNPEKARCCADCGGFPGFKCNCGEDFVEGGSCKVCCVVCENGFVSTPQLVPDGTTCDAVAALECEKKGGSNPNKSGWKASCQ